MSKKKAYKKKKDSNELKEPLTIYNSNSLKIFNSFQEQEAYELEQMASLSGVEILVHLRRFINLAFGMHGYNPDKLPKKHSIKIIKKDEYI